MIDEQCVEWKTGEKCCSGGSCCDDEPVNDDPDPTFFQITMEEYFTEPITSGTLVIIAETESKPTIRKLYLVEPFL